MNKFSQNKLFSVIILTLPFLLNDFANIFIHNYLAYLLIDYIFVKLFPITLIIYLLRSNSVSLNDIGFRKIRLGRYLLLSFVLIIVGTVIDQIGWRFFSNIFPNTQLGGFPSSENYSSLFIFDLYFGLILVSFVEEIIFRGFYYHFFKSKSFSKSLTVILPSIIFGLIHWSLGLHAIINTAIIGAVFMYIMIRERCIYPLITAHLAINFIAFSGVVPNEWFEFLY